MATQGPWVVFNAAKLKFLNQTLKLNSDTFNIILCNSSQALTAAFSGTSGNCEYSDLTGELATANGYVAGGNALSGVSLTETSGVVTFTSTNPSWTLTGGGITFKYAVIRDVTDPSGGLVFFCDMDTGGGSVSPLSGTLTLAISPSGIVTLQ
jgi:hypothetical protein